MKNEKLLKFLQEKGIEIFGYNNDEGTHDFCFEIDGQTYDTEHLEDEDDLIEDLNLSLEMKQSKMGVTKSMNKVSDLRIIMML